MILINIFYLYLQIIKLIASSNNKCNFFDQNYFIYYEQNYIKYRTSDDRSSESLMGTVLLPFDDIFILIWDINLCPRFQSV